MEAVVLRELGPPEVLAVGQVPVPDPATRDFTELLAAIEAGTWTPVIDSVRPLAEVAQTPARMEAGEHFGKLVLEVS